MIDGIIKADGTSRLMRANLPATYEEFKTQAATGTLPFDVLFNSEGWSQLPTFLNKGNLLSDFVANMFGMGMDAVPNDALGYLGKYAQHWWKRRSTSGYTVSFGSDEIIKTHDTSGSAAQVRYSDVVNIAENGTLSLNNPETITVNAGDNTLVGRYFEAAANCSFSSGVIYFGVTAPAWDFSEGEDCKMTARRVSVVSGNASDWEIVRSSNRNEYPDSGIFNGYEYKYMCNPLENAAVAPKIATGSYTGTGKYGRGNKNQLTFDFEPKFVYITQSDVYTAVTVMLIKGLTGASVVGQTSKEYRLTVSWNGNSVTWYAASATTGAHQVNASGTTYRYVAIG